MKRILLIIIFTLIAPTPTFAETGWRYWGYFQSPPKSTTWIMAQTGPTTIIPDGSVEGWVFTFSSESVEPREPRQKPSFSKICRKVREKSGMKRVGVVVDFGPAAIRPKGESMPKRITACLSLEMKATGADALAAATKVRFASSGFLCGINGYPAEGCATNIKTPRSLQPSQS
jgi:hypothetical protein